MIYDRRNDDGHLLYIFKKRKQTFDEEKYFCLSSFKYERTRYSIKVGTQMKVSKPVVKFKRVLLYIADDAAFTE